MELKAELIAPFSDEERAEFITKNCYELSYEIKAVNFREEDKEIEVQDVELVTREETIETPVMQDVEKVRQELVYDEEGNVVTEEKEVEVTDEEGNVTTTTETVPVYKDVTYIVQEPVYEEVTTEEGTQLVPKVTKEVKEITEEVPVFDEVTTTVTDEDGTEHEVTTKVPRMHTEIVQVEIYDLEAWGKTEEELDEEEKERIGLLTCTKRVFVLMLQELGITYAQVKELVASDEQAELEWDLCISLQRNNPLIDTFGAKLGLTSEQIDMLFKTANGMNSVEELRATVGKE